MQAIPEGALPVEKGVTLFLVAYVQVLVGRVMAEAVVLAVLALLVVRAHQQRRFL
jgi:hypothetical protein